MREENKNKMEQIQREHGRKQRQWMDKIDEQMQIIK